MYLASIDRFNKFVFLFSHLYLRFGLYDDGVQRAARRPPTPSRVLIPTAQFPEQRCIRRQYHRNVMAYYLLSIPKRETENEVYYYLRDAVCFPLCSIMEFDPNAHH